MSFTLPWLEPDSYEFPDPATALREPNGLLAAGGDLAPERLLQAYRCGIFPWFEDDQPPLWWSPDPRMVLLPDELHISRSMHKFLKNHSYRITSDANFAAVIAACSAPRSYSDGTWITNEMQAAYIELHQLGWAHSIEIWEEQTLVGGLYGIAMGNLFFGESMFSFRPNVSKLAFIDLVQQLKAGGYALIDCQVANPHLSSLGARTMPRAEFMTYLPALTQAQPKNVAKAGSEICSNAIWPYNKPVDQR